MTDPMFPAAWRRGVYEAIAQRHERRDLRPEPVAPEVLARILSAAHQAGRADLTPPWRFLVITDPTVRHAVRTQLDGIGDAPVHVCITCDPAPAAIASAEGALQNLWLAARAEGIGVSAVTVREPAALRTVLGIPASVVPVAYLGLGHVDHFPAAPGPDPERTPPVFQDAWGQAPGPDLARALERGTLVGPRVGTETPGRGLLLVYTGQGKGKTTAALGVVFRALGRGLRVAVVQFIKGKWKTGERLFAETLPELTFLVMGQGFTWESDDLSRDRNAAIAAWNRTKELIAAGAHSVIVLDEITYAINYGFIDGDDVVATFASRPAHVHVLVTGRNAPDALCAAADLVTEMKPVKHPFAQGHKAQPGIDF